MAAMRTTYLNMIVPLDNNGMEFELFIVPSPNSLSPSIYSINGSLGKCDLHAQLQVFLVGHATGTQLKSVSTVHCLSDMSSNLVVMSLWSTLCILILTAPYNGWQVPTVRHDEGVTHNGVVNRSSRIVNAGSMTRSGCLLLHRWIHYRHNIWYAAWLVR